MATLPARQFISLDALVTRAKGGAKLVLTPATIPRHQPRPLAALERDSALATTLAERFVKPAAPPSALVLWVTVATCACGRVYRLPPAHALIKYAENEHSFHYRRDDDALAALPPALPREVREKSVVIPFCEECFAVPPEAVS